VAVRVLETACERERDGAGELLVEAVRIEAVVALAILDEDVADRSRSRATADDRVEVALGR
jgi:hypothetical protein